MPRRSGVTAPSFASPMNPGLRVVVVRSSERYSSLPSSSEIAQNGRGSSLRHGDSARSAKRIAQPGAERPSSIREWCRKRTWTVAVLLGLIDKGNSQYGR